MIFSGVEILKLQFSRAVDQTFEHFLNSWTLPLSQEEARVQSLGSGNLELPTEISVISSN